MNAQQEAVALYRYLEGRGFKPSVRSIGAMLRVQKISFTDTSLRAWLKDFAAAPTQPTAEPPQKSSTNDAPPPQADANPPRLRAHDKVSLVSKKVTPSPSRPKPLRLVVDPPPDRRTPAEREADRAIAIMRPAIESVLAGQTITEWRKQNRRYVVDMVASGMTAEEIAEAHDEYRVGGEVIFSMRRLQGQIVAAASRPLDVAASEPRLYTLADMQTAHG